jgi:hypothetical protein
MYEALTTTLPVGELTPGVTTGSSFGENVTTWPSLVVNASRAGNPVAASPDVDDADAPVDGSEVVSRGWSVDWLLDVARASPHEVRSSVKAMVVCFLGIHMPF